MTTLLPSADPVTLAQAYARDGYVVLDRALDPAEVAALNTEALAVCRGDRGAIKGTEAARPGETDAEVLRRILCIHMPHKISPLLRRALHHPAVVAALTTLIGPNVKAMQSMLFVKSEGKPGQAWHQDEQFIPTRDRSLTAAWIALDDATVENGCLWVLPGSHRAGVLYPQRVIEDDRFDCTAEAYAFPFRDEDAVPVEIPAGSVVLFNGYLLHRSLPNTGRHGLRRALALHYMSAESLLPWTPPPAGYDVGMHDYRDVELVAGTDPYAWRGLADIASPEVRPDREGGCLSWRRTLPERENLPLR